MRLEAAQFRDQIRRHLFGDSSQQPGEGISTPLGIDISRTLVSGDTFPLAYQVEAPGVFPDMILVSPDLCDFAGTLQNGNIAIRIWGGKYFNNGDWKSSWSPPSSTPYALHRQMLSQSVHVPWYRRSCIFVVQFAILTGQTVAAGNTIGVSIAPWTP